MRLISRFDARALSLAELYSLRKAMFVAMRASPRGSHGQRLALASMRNIEAELAARTPRP